MTGTSERRRPARHRAARIGLGALHGPRFAGNEWRYLRACLDSGWVSSAGPFVERFEAALAARTGARHVIATQTGSAALHVALPLAGIAPGDEVLLPALTFIAPFSAVRACGAVPVLLDVADDWQLDADRLAAFLARECRLRAGRCINRRTGRRVRAIIAVHLLGLACPMDAIVAVARRYGLQVIEDAAQALGVAHRGRHPGTFGDIGILSFNGNKTATAGGGGALLVADARRAARARRLTMHGRSLAQPLAPHRELGSNYRMSNLHAALGLAQLEQLDAILARKRRIAAAYARGFADVADVTPMPCTPQTEASWWLYTIRLRSAAQRQRVQRALTAAGIGAGPLWPPLDRHVPARDCPRDDLRHAHHLHARSLCLPSSPDLVPAEVRRCVEAVRQAVGC